METEMELMGVRIVGLPNGLELICKLYEDEDNYKLSRSAMLVPTGTILLLVLVLLSLLRAVPWAETPNLLLNLPRR